MALLLTNFTLSGESAEEAAQERQRGRPGAAGRQGGHGPSGDSDGGRGGGHCEAAAEAGAREGGVAEAAAVARRPHEALGDGGGRQGGRVARGQGRGAARTWLLSLHQQMWAELHLITLINISSNELDQILLFRCRTSFT